MDDEHQKKPILRVYQYSGQSKWRLLFTIQHGLTDMDTFFENKKKSSEEHIQVARNID